MVAGSRPAPTPPEGERSEQDLARESSLVCRENKKLRERNALLEAQETEALKSLHAELAARPTQHILAELRAALGEAEKARADAEARAEAMDGARTALERELSRANGELDELRDALKLEASDGRERERALKSEVEALRKRLLAAQAMASGGDNETIGTLQTQLAAARDAAEALRIAAERQRDEHEAALEALRAEVASLRRAADQGTQSAIAEAAAEAAERRVASLVEQLAAAQAKLKASEQSEAQSRRASKAAAEEAREARRALSELEEQRTLERKKARALAEAQQHELREARRAAADAAKEAAELRERLARHADAGAAAEATELELRRAKKEAAEQRSRAEGARDELKAERESTAGLRRDVAARDDQIEALRREVARLQQALTAGLTPRPPCAPKAPPSGFGDFVALRREIVDLRQQLAERLPVGATVDPAGLLPASAPSSGDAGAAGWASDAAAGGRPPAAKPFGAGGPHTGPGFAARATAAHAAASGVPGVRSVHEVATARGSKTWASAGQTMPRDRDAGGGLVSPR